VNTLTHSYDTVTVVPLLLLVKPDSFLEVVYKSVQFFFASSCAKLYIETSEWTQVLKEVQGHYLIFGYDKIPLKFLLNIFVT
jgi:hypothetical protein